MKTALLALYNYRACGQEAWADHGAAITYEMVKHLGVDFIDMKKFFSREELKDNLKGYDLIAFGLKSASYNLGMEVVDIAKELRAKVLVGGIHTAAAPQELINNEKIDYIFYGESEITFPRFLRYPEAFSREIRGEVPQDLDALPFIDREIFREPVEDGMGWNRAKTMQSVIAARGCPFNCSFCMPLERNHFGKKVRRRSAINLVEEITILKQRYNPEFLMIYDDTFLLNRKWLEDFIAAYSKVKIPFWAGARADGVCDNSDLIKKLAKVGMRILSIGFESGSQRILNMIRKGTTVEQNLEAARIGKEAGLLIYCNYMLGFPTETKEEVMMTMRMADEIDAYLPCWAFFSPYPGNDLGEECIRDGLSLLGRYQYNRFPYEPKIKGVDYNYLNKVLAGFRE